MGVEWGKVLGWRVGCRNWERMVVGEERNKAPLVGQSLHLAFSAAVLVKRMLSFLFSLR